MEYNEQTTQAKMMVRYGLFFLFFLVALTVGLSYFFTGTFNPIDIYSTGTKTQIVIVTMLLTFVALTLLGVIGCIFQIALIGSRGPDPRVLSGINVGVVIVLLLGLSYWKTGSLNPCDLFQMGSIFWIVLTTVLLGILTIQLFSFLSVVTIIWRIETDSTNSYRDVYCKFCDDPILVVVGLKRKLPIKCPHCNEWVHMVCWRKAGGSILHRCDCQQCQPRQSFDDINELFHNI